jgi:hypothetical protein
MAQTKAKDLSDLTVPHSPVRAEYARVGAKVGTNSTYKKGCDKWESFQTEEAIEWQN